MKAKFWGCRGSITTPGPGTVRYGGNSTCVEIRSDDGNLTVIDAGSGIRNFGKALRQEKGIRSVRFFFTHSHWDHLVGFPFFEPAYLPGYVLTFCGGPHAQESIRKYLSRQMEAPFFPVDFDWLKATFNFRCDRSAEKPGTCCIDKMEVRQIPLSHPNGGYGFKFTERGRTFVFLTDNELGFQHPEGLTRREYIEFARGADLLIHDAQYTDEEYKITRGWGHSTFRDATDLAMEAGVRRFGIFHHDPDRTDDDLDRMVDFCRARIGRTEAGVECFAAAEGMVIEV